MASATGIVNPVDGDVSLFRNLLPPVSGKPTAYIITAFMFLLIVYAMQGNKSKLPRYNPTKPFELTTRRVMYEFMPRGLEMMVQARKKYGQQPYRLYSDLGDVVVFPGEAMQEIRNNPALSFTEMANFDGHGYLPGFEPFYLSIETVRVVNRYLTKALGKLTMPLSHEADIAFRKAFTDSFEWHEIPAAQDIARAVSRISTRIFMGPELCDNDEWVECVASYSRNAFSSGHEIRRWPYWARRVVHWFLPSANHVRQLLVDCRRILQPVVDERKKLKAAARARGEPEPVFDDALTWFEKEYGENYDPAIAQITLSTVAIDTTSDLMQSTMQQLARHPEYMQPLRDEIVEVLGKQGLKKTALYNLKFMDSFLKETQRMKPILTGLRRQAKADVKLENGMVIRKGDRLLIDTVNMRLEEHFENPGKFDPYRFLRWREQGNENIAHLVSTSEKHMGFGHGEHACPGRFFAANELKIALCHVLLKYEWKLPEGHDPDDVVVGCGVVASHDLRLLVRRREPELDMSNLTDK